MLSIIMISNYFGNTVIFITYVTIVRQTTLESSLHLVGSAACSFPFDLPLNYEAFHGNRVNMEPYIVGGQHAKIEQFPHAVYMVLTCNGVAWICGASVLTQNLVLSVAHCFNICSNDLDVVIYVGSSDIRKVKVAIKVPFFVLHESFDARTYLGDIALARTQKDMPLGRTVKRVIIRREFPVINELKLAGWGTVHEAKLQQTERLMWMVHYFRPGGICSQFAVPPGHICLENSIQRRPSIGDSGSALMSNAVQIGIVSFRHPSLVQLVTYTNVSYYYDWIQRNAELLACLET